MTKHRRQPAIPGLAADDAMSEDEFQRLVIAEANLQGWTSMHVTRSKVGGYGGRPIQWVTNTMIRWPNRKNQSKGWPDLTLMHPNGFVLYLELKSAAGKASPEQRELLQLLQSLEAPTNKRVRAFLVRPADYPAVANMLARANRVAPARTMSTSPPADTTEGA